MRICFKPQNPDLLLIHKKKKKKKKTQICLNPKLIGFVEIFWLNLGWCWVSKLKEMRVFFLAVCCYLLLGLVAKRVGKRTI